MAPFTAPSLAAVRRVRWNASTRLEQAESVWLRVDVDRLVYRYSYSFDGETWHTVPVTYEAWKLSDDYIGGRGFFTGAFVGLHCEDISGDGCHADFDYFTYEPV